MQVAPRNRAQSFAPFASFMPGELALLRPGQVLVIHSQERIVTLVDQGTIVAQGRCSTRAFRALLLLLFAPGGADYGSLYAALELDEEELGMALQQRSMHSKEFEAAAQRWRRYLTNQPTNAVRRAELLPLRRVMRGATGLDRFLTEGGFLWKIKAATWRAEASLSRGYALTEEKGSPTTSNIRSFPAFGSRRQSGM
jgi:hypothetical protein